LRDAGGRVYKSAKFKGIMRQMAQPGLGNGTIEGGYIVIRVSRADG
jgi:hypothetical protein